MIKAQDRELVIKTAAILATGKYWDSTKSLIAAAVEILDAVDLEIEKSGFEIPVISNIAERPCPECGERHELKGFEINAKVRTKVSRNRLGNQDHIPPGVAGYVWSSSQYNAPFHYRVAFPQVTSEHGDTVRATYYPCELENV